MNYRESEETEAAGRALRAALAGMAAEARGKEAPARVERALRRAYRERHGAPRRRMAWAWWAAATAAAAIVTMMLLVPQRTAPAPAAPRITAQVIAPAPVVAPVVLPAAAPRPRPAARHAARVRPPVRRAPEPAEFLPLPYAPGAAPATELWVARMRVSRAALAAAGLPMNMERADEAVVADVAFAGDGTARAVRILR